MSEIELGELPPGFANRTPTRVRDDGWTPIRRRNFLEAMSEGHTVEAACSFVGLSVSSAYALRRRASGAAFALGWQAASLLARDTLADRLTTRALDGQVETYTRADGTELTRHRYDNRLACAMLTRLDRLAAFPVGGPENFPAEPGDAAVARIAAEDFAGFLALIANEEEGARAFDDFRDNAIRRTLQLPQLKHTDDADDEDGDHDPDDDDEGEDEEEAVEATATG